MDHDATYDESDVGLSAAMAAAMPADPDDLFEQAAPPVPITLADTGLSRPDLFCGLRSVLEVFGAKMSTPDVALQLIVPAMFIFMAVRFMSRAIAASAVFVSSDLAADKVEGG